MCYRDFLAETESPWCWYCGRGLWDKPAWWNAGFLIERAHIVSMSRVEDRRVIIALCSACHFATHNQSLFGYTLPAATVGHMLWLKRTFDREYYDPEFMRKYSVGNLPKCLVPPAVVMREFASRQGSYPNG